MNTHTQRDVSPAAAPHPAVCVPMHIHCHEICRVVRKIVAAIQAHAVSKLQLEPIMLLSPTIDNMNSDRGMGCEHTCMLV